METDYSCSDLPDDEIAEHMARVTAEKDLERSQYEERMRKARNFRFSGGLC